MQGPTSLTTCTSISTHFLVRDEMPENSALNINILLRNMILEESFR